MRISKHTFQEYCNDDKYAQKLMSLVAAKLPTKTMPIIIDSKGTEKTIATVDAMDVIKLSESMFESNHPRVSKETWKDIQQVALSTINKGLAQ